MGGVLGKGVQFRNKRGGYRLELGVWHFEVWNSRNYLRIWIHAVYNRVVSI